MTSVSGPGLAAWVASGALVRTDVARAVATSSRHGARRGWTGERDMAMTPRMLTVGQAGARKVYRSDVAGVKEALFSPRPVNSRTGGLRLAVAWPGTGTAVSITDRGRTCVLPGDRQSPVRLIGEFTDPGRGPRHRDILWVVRLAMTLSPPQPAS